MPVRSIKVRSKTRNGARYFPPLTHVALPKAVGRLGGARGLFQGRGAGTAPTAIPSARSQRRETTARGGDEGWRGKWVQHSAYVYSSGNSSSGWSTSKHVDSRSLLRAAGPHPPFQRRQHATRGSSRPLPSLLNPALKNACLPNRGRVLFYASEHGPQWQRVTTTPCQQDSLG